jgi:TonB family protein
MVSYQVVSQQNKEAVVKYNAPTNGAALGASLFYMAAQAPITGQVSWKTPDTKTDSEESMTLYVNEIQDRIQQNWQLPEGVSSPDRAVAYLMIDRDGSLLSATIKQSSGNKQVDKAALNAVIQSAPYGRVPTSAVSLPVEVEYVFERVAPEPTYW